MGMISHGFAVNTLEVSGIPVASVLQEMKDKAAVRRALAIPEGQPAVLLMGGGLPSVRPRKTGSDRYRKRRQQGRRGDPAAPERRTSNVLP